MTADAHFGSTPANAVFEPASPVSQGDPDTSIDYDETPDQHSRPLDVTNVDSDENNWLGVTALITGIAFAPVGIIFGHLALRAVKSGTANNYQVARTGLVLGYALTALSLLYGLVVLPLVLR